ncbi:hypothetical protein TNCT_157381 [Trichonephila clavata]|uniref:Uncharacterized protein n=1 Tax=Trichonephila clavata TaxID=2740835 RepID=A0A8X6HFA6_TRICU|nr:hypothetical protein TNCT_157381 [Trichonephila clavata]
MEHRNEAHTTPLLPDGPRKFHKSKTSPRHFLLGSSRVSLRRPIHSELLATFLHLSRRRGSRHRGPHEPAPSSGGPRKISKSKTTRSRHRLHHSLFPSTPTLSSLDSHTSLAPTSPDGGAPVTRARMSQRPLPVDLEKFRSPLPVLCIALLFHIKLDPLTCEPRTNRAPLLPGPHALFRWTSRHTEFFFSSSPSNSPVFGVPFEGTVTPKGKGAPAEPASPPDEG